MTVRGSVESVEARLRTGLLVCWCGGTLRPWGQARLLVPGRPGQYWSVPASTASSWLSRFAGRADALRQAFLGLLPLVDPQGRVMVSAGSVIGTRWPRWRRSPPGCGHGSAAWTCWRPMRWLRT
jgi:hypothetical protein